MVHSLMFKKINFQIVTIILLSVFLVISVASLYAQKKIIDQLISQNPPQFTSTIIPTVTIEPTSANQLSTADKEIKFLVSPVKVNVNFFNVSSKPDELEYYSLHFDKAEAYYSGDFIDGDKLIVVSIPEDGPGGPYTAIYKFKQTKDDQYYFLPYYSNEYSTFDTMSQNYTDYIGQIFTKAVSLSSHHYSQLDEPEVLETNIGALRLTGGAIQPSQLSSLVKIADPHVYVKQQKYDKLDGIFVNQYYVKLPDSSVVSYKIDVPFYKRGSYNPPIIWSDGTSNQDSFNTFIESHCGNGLVGDYILSSSSSLAKKLSVAGKVDGQDVYKIIDPSSPFIKLLYSLFIQTAPTPAISIEEYATKNSHFFYPSSSGDFLVFINGQYTIQAECGKPVIYLYPTKTTPVSVKVGADISQSDPIYPATGWKTIAHPNGQLIVDSKFYPFLFWEGTGHGLYPDLNGKGFVVDQANLLPTIKSHLHLLGLNTKETADFLEFWQLKLPQTKYVRLSWLGTADMNQLAPLDVYPRPDTTIRVFLEFEGLDSPIKLEPQLLTSPPRRGFTLVEWGGLLTK